MSRIWFDLLSPFMPTFMLLLGLWAGGSKKKWPLGLLILLCGGWIVFGFITTHGAK